MGCFKLHKKLMSQTLFIIPRHIYWSFKCYQGGKINNIRWQAIPNIYDAFSKENRPSGITTMVLE